MLSLRPIWRHFEKKYRRQDPLQLRRKTLARLGILRAPLETLARVSGTDKAGPHEYMGAYERVFREFRNRPITLLEMGVGGYQQGDGGRSLSLWEAYFRRGTIVGIDIYDKSALSRGRIQVHQCSQTDAAGLQRLAQRYGGFDLVIDDGSHMNQHQVQSFLILFPVLKTPGVYVIEDTQTSYWPAYGGGAVGTAAHAASAMGFFTSLIDGLNHAEFLPVAGIPATPFRDQIRAIYFEHGLIAVLKGDNTASSNIPIDALADVLENKAARTGKIVRADGGIGNSC
jgi:hypothetical protein